MEKTKYRIINDGYMRYLQYLTVSKFLWVKFKTWKYIPCTYEDKGFDFMNYISSYNTPKLNNFAEKYPNIETYLAEYIQLKEEFLKKEREKAHKRYDASKKIEYLN